MLFGFANNSDHSLAPDDAAVFADQFDGRADFHPVEEFRSYILLPDLGIVQSMILT
jgi:hypothetical protein